MKHRGGEGGRKEGGRREGRIKGKEGERKGGRKESMEGREGGKLGGCFFMQPVLAQVRARARARVVSSCNLY